MKKSNMGRTVLDFRIKKIGEYYYYKLPTMNNFKTTKLKSEAKAKNYVISLLRKQVVFSDCSTYTFRQYAKDFFDYEKCPRLKRLRSEGKDRVKRSCDNARKDLVNYVFKSSFSRLVLKDIRKADVLNLRQELLKRTTPGRVNDIITAVKIVFSEAVYNEHIMYNPARNISSLAETHKPVTVFSSEDYDKLFSIDDVGKMIKIWGTYADFIIEFIERWTGMRNGEARCLKWKNIDFDNGYIYITNAFKDQDSKTIGCTKNGKERIAPLCPQLRKALINYKEHYAFHTDNDDFVCCNKDGSPFNYKRNKRHHKSALERAGVEYKSIHVYRHTFATELEEKGVSKSAIRACLGWADERIQSRYTHAEKNDADLLRGAFDVSA